jgi:hypothetical protein
MIKILLLLSILSASAAACFAQQVERIDYKVNKSLQHRQSSAFDSVQVQYIIQLHAPENLQKLLVKTNGESNTRLYKKELIYLVNENKFIDKNGTLYPLNEKNELVLDALYSSGDFEKMKIKEIYTELTDRKGKKKIKKKKDFK